MIALLLAAQLAAAAPPLKVATYAYPKYDRAAALKPMADQLGAVIGKEMADYAEVMEPPANITVTPVVKVAEQGANLEGKIEWTIETQAGPDAKTYTTKATSELRMPGEKDKAPPATPVSNPAPEPRAASSLVTPPAAPVTPITGAPASDRAAITVTLPAGATLYVDDRKSPSAGPVLQFTTPPLPGDREFAYLMKAEVVRDGRPEYLIQKVAFRAGERLTVDFTGLGR